MTDIWRELTSMEPTFCPSDSVSARCHRDEDHLMDFLNALPRSLYQARAYLITPAIPPSAVRNSSRFNNSFMELSASLVPLLLPLLFLDPSTGQRIGIGSRIHGLYYLDQLHLPSPRPSACPVTPLPLSDLWHRRLGHVSS
ncbi:uncharacterized protein [Typha angustifolia]|uniref:uncharacterized protein n=1 Tax=Typha angustifolia TaxID=59011 RepID=UPI003C2BF599